MSGTLWIGVAGAPEPPFLPCEGWECIGQVESIDIALQPDDEDDG